ncbi:MAG TPA: hypothetical protein VN673_02630 [Clostridia bacterium]|nr:hypothetical protein [Clostridia bacterium]
MNRFLGLLCLILAALWAPITAHCAVEAVCGFDLLTCCSHAEAAPHQDDDCARDGCSVVESGLYKIDEQPVTAPPMVLLTSCARAGAQLPESVLSFPIPVVAPPGLSQGWQFSCRTALPVRAPSLTA